MIDSPDSVAHSAKLILTLLYPFFINIIEIFRAGKLVDALFICSELDVVYNISDFYVDNKQVI